MNVDCKNEPKRKRRRVADNLKNLYDAIKDANKTEVFKILKQGNLNLQTFHQTSKSSYTTSLHLVFTHFKEADVMEILESFFQNFDVDRPDSSKKSVLHLAVMYRMKKVIDFLLERNADILIQDDGGNFITHHFIEIEHFKLNKRSYANDCKSYNKSAMEKGSISFVKWLISKGFNFDYENRKGIRALDLAIQYDLQHILPTLLKHTSDMKFVNKKNKRTLLHSFLAARNCNNHIRIGFDCPRRNIWSQDFTQRYDLEIIKILLNNDVSVDAVDAFGKTALRIAVEKKMEMDIVEMLLERCTNVSHEHLGQTLLHEVIEKTGEVPSHIDYYIKIIRALIAKGATIKNDDHGKIMDDILQSRSVTAVELMKDVGVDFQMEISHGQNLLHRLVFSTIFHKPATGSEVKSLEAIFDFFVSEGCDVNKPDDKGQTPLHWALEYRSCALARKLIASGADVMCRDNEKGNTPLHLAAARDGLVELAELLIDTGSDVNDKNNCNERPLYLSILNKTNDMSKMLLKRGAYVDVESDIGKTALSHAIRKNQPASIEELFKYGADYNHPDVTMALEFVDVIGRLKIHHAWLQCVLPHWDRLKAAKLLDRWTGWDHLVPRERDNVEYLGKFSEEIGKLKSTMIDSRTSVYQFLHMDIENRCFHIKNEKFLKLINSELFEKDFPNYYVVILGSYREAVARKSLLEPAKERWIELTDIDLPDICIERVFSYVSNVDLVVLIERNEVASK